MSDHQREYRDNSLNSRSGHPTLLSFHEEINRTRTWRHPLQLNMSGNSQCRGKGPKKAGDLHSHFIF
jgi:hypothetical protein